MLAPWLIWPIQRAALSRDELVQIGIRSVDEDEKRFVHEQGLEVFDMRSIDEMGMRTVMQQALHGVDDDTYSRQLRRRFRRRAGAGRWHWWCPVAPPHREAHLCMEMIADTGALHRWTSWN